MEGVGAPAALERGIEAALRHDRKVVVASLTAVVVLAWLYLWHMAADMDRAAMAMATMPRSADAGALALTFLMWAVMMAGMMLPSAAPTILLYGALVRKSGAKGMVLPGVWIFAGAYLLVWSGFSVAATLLQALLEHEALLTPAMATASVGLGALALIAAGVYQLTPLKHICLRKCRNPLEFFVMRWRAGPGGAFRMGLEHGAYCVGCCWALMLLLFVAGVMNLAWVALIAVFVFVEKLFPAAGWTSRVASAALILSGLYLLAGF
jgi:predicted metal-binding membrane protein